MILLRHRREKSVFNASVQALRQLCVLYLMCAGAKLTMTCPSLGTPNGIYFEVGQELEVVCKSDDKNSTSYEIEVKNPFGNDCRQLSQTDSRFICEEKSFSEAGTNIGFQTKYQKLTVQNVQMNDSGPYICSFKANRTDEYMDLTRTIQIFDHSKGLLSATTDEEFVEVKSGESAQWLIKISSFPANFTTLLYNPKGKEVELGKDKNYNFSRIQHAFEHDTYLLKIYNVELKEHNGSYALTLHLPYADVNPVTLKLQLNVLVEPKINLATLGSTTKNCMVNEICELNCTAEGNPPPKITWYSRGCGVTAPLNCKDAKKVEAEEVSAIVQNVENFTTKSTLKYVAMEHVNLTCYGENSVGQSNDTRFMRVVDYPDEGYISIIHPDEIIEGDDVELVCAVTKLLQNDYITWIKYDNGKDISLPQTIPIVKSETQWSNRASLIFKNISLSHTGGLYHCKSYIGLPKYDIRDSVKLNVSKATPPKINITNLKNSTETIDPMGAMNLTCIAQGKPNPTIKWMWGNMSLPKSLNYKLKDNNTVLLLKNVSTEAQGVFKCIAENRVGSDTAFLNLAVKGVGPEPTMRTERAPFSNGVALTIILLMIFTLLVFGVIFGHFRMKQNELRKSLKEISQQEFDNGAVESINPNLSLTDQAYLLPFDARWEFPKERLKFGLQLGSGAFGRVVKAEAYGIVESENVTTVAVKMVKPNAAEVHFKALMSELKIMVHLGKHVNVVNLLGACTKNLTRKRELLVIVEYCKYGSLLNYMHRHKETFVNELDHEGTTVYTKLGWQTTKSAMQSTSQDSIKTPVSGRYKTLDEVEQLHGFSVNTSSSDEGSDNNFPTRESSIPQECFTPNSNSNESLSADQNDTNEETPSLNQYRGDYVETDVAPMRTSDLLCWAFQVAQGMDYLASRKVLHSDLAARNVLLAENNVVKICDFGLAKEIYKNYKYSKKSEVVMLPVKWMAVESMQYGVFSTQSDCWSFGVFLWELFTLGKTPYPGMDVDERFCKRIAEGYRLEKPPLAPSCIYDLMLECWAQNPNERPSFTAIVSRIGDMMEENIRNYYIEINHPYLKINQTYFSSGGIDYLLQMGRSSNVDARLNCSVERCI